jgi:uncharacterized membrane protein YuzA (DUF378 family)
MNPIKGLYTFVFTIAEFLVLVGALNWGLIGLTKTDAVVVIFPKEFVRSVHIAVGVAALLLILRRLLF